MNLAGEASSEGPVRVASPALNMACPLPAAHACGGSESAILPCVDELKKSENERLGRKNRRDTLVVIGVAIVLFSLAFLAVKLFDPGYSREPLRRSEYVLDDLVTISIYGKDRSRVEEAMGAAFDELFRLQSIADRYDPESELSRLNAAAAAGPVTVSEDLWAMVETGREVYEASGGLFDITVGPLIDVWDVAGRGGKGEPPPGEEEIAEAREKVGMGKLALDAAGRSVAFSVPGMGIDLGGLAKGYAIDRAVEVLRSRGIETCIVDMVSTTLLLGDKPGDSGPLWSVDILNPRVQEGRLANLSLPGGKYLSTSGDYQRFFEYGGVRYHHILDPRTGYPARGAMAVTVVGNRGGAWTDAMSTAAFVMGCPDGMRWIEDEGADAVMVGAGGEVQATEGMEQWLTAVEERVE